MTMPPSPVAGPPGGPDQPLRDPAEMTLLLGRLVRGEDSAGQTLLPVVAEELRAIAGGLLRRERADHTLQPTALVNEAWMRLFQGDDGAAPEGRRHFFALAAKVMRQVLVDHARRRGREKRGGGDAALPLDEALVALEVEGLDLLDLNAALEELAALDERQARVVELRFFGGLEAEEAAEVLGVSLSTVERDWRVARAWLYQRLRQ
jgi:RNA polymerase sigma-70 factor (ECF subfamily)